MGFVVLASPDRYITQIVERTRHVRFIAKSAELFQAAGKKGRRELVIRLVVRNLPQIYQGSRNTSGITRFLGDREIFLQECFSPGEVTPVDGHDAEIVE